jgi:DNA helicase-2/ATP-dependent DNA helicase PcrA
VASEVDGGGLTTGERVFHQKCGYGRITRYDGNKLTIDFEKAGEKRVIDSFVERT